METKVAPFSLMPPLCLIEPLSVSGETESGIYVIDHETDMDKITSMLVEVVGKRADSDVTLGAACVVPVYSWETFEYDGEVYNVMNENVIIAELEGYFD